jgi:hypothetical protein
MSNPPPPVYRQSGEVVARQVGSEWILVPIRRSPDSLDFVYTLDEVAAFVWELIDGKHSIDEIVTRLSAEFDVDYDIAIRDVESLLADLAAESLIVPQP